jgi:hypothetical protein
MEPNDRDYDVVDMAEAYERHERGDTMKSLCPCCGGEMVTKSACPIGCPGPESGSKWTRQSHVNLAAALEVPQIRAALEACRAYLRDDYDDPNKRFRQERDRAVRALLACEVGCQPAPPRCHCGQESSEVHYDGNGDPVCWNCWEHVR